MRKQFCHQLWKDATIVQKHQRAYITRLASGRTEAGDRLVRARLWLGEVFVRWGTGRFSRLVAMCILQPSHLWEGETRYAEIGPIISSESVEERGRCTLPWSPHEVVDVESEQGVHGRQKSVMGSRRVRSRASRLSTRPQRPPPSLPSRRVFRHVSARHKH